MSAFSIPGRSELEACVLAGTQTEKCPLQPHVYRSWQRCLNEFHLDRELTRPPETIARPALDERRERHPELLTAARVEMTNLYQQMANSGSAILLTDGEGVILNYVGDPSFNDAATRSGLQPGAIWTESSQGSNGMGTCLVEKKPLIIHHREHFLLKNTGLTCSAAPIFDPHGRLTAVLDASSESTLAQQHTLALVSMSAQMIENRLFISSYKAHYLARFHSRPEFVGTLSEGIVAFDGAGVVLAMNRNALFQFELQCAEQLIGKPLSEIFATPFSALMDQAAKRSFYPAPLWHATDGKRFYAIIQSPESSPRTRTGSGRSPDKRPGHDKSEQCRLANLTFGDPQMARNIHRATRVLALGIPVILYGETGSGKEVFARSLHRSSDRAGKPFVAVNCAAIPETLIESELFGYRPGAFTGASRHGSPGKIVQANKGTLFLDEIGDMPLPLQARLLRVLEQDEVVPLGGDGSISVDIQVISATHRDIQALVRSGQFREDLYYRLQGISLQLPPLRERTDKRELIEHLLEDYQPEGEAVSLSSAVMQRLLAYEWPGNIRQLCNVLRTMVALREGPVINLSDIPDELLAEQERPRDTEGGLPVLDDPLALAERTALLNELRNRNWNVVKVARRLNLSRNTIYRKMRVYGIKPPR